MSRVTVVSQCNKVTAILDGHRKKEKKYTRQNEIIDPCFKHIGTKTPSLIM